MLKKKEKKKMVGTSSGLGAGIDSSFLKGNRFSIIHIGFTASYLTRTVVEVTNYYWDSSCFRKAV